MNQTVLITGASRGIGKAIALRAARDGAKRLRSRGTLGDQLGRDYERCNLIVAHLGGGIPVTGDITSDGGAQELFQQLAPYDIDHLINNAGGQFPVPVVIRTTAGSGRQLAAQHSHSFEPIFAHVPGLRVLSVATLEDARRVIEPKAGVLELHEAETALRALQTDLTNALRQKERLAQLGGAVAKVSHDLRNILTAAQLFADRIEASRVRVRSVAMSTSPASEAISTLTESTPSRWTPPTPLSGRALPIPRLTETPRRSERRPSRNSPIQRESA